MEPQPARRNLPHSIGPWPSLALPAPVTVACREDQSNTTSPSSPCTDREVEAGYAAGLLRVTQLVEDRIRISTLGMQGEKKGL